MVVTTESRSNVTRSVGPFEAPIKIMTVLRNNAFQSLKFNAETVSEHPLESNQSMH